MKMSWKEKVFEIVPLAKDGTDTVAIEWVPKRGVYIVHPIGQRFPMEVMLRIYREAFSYLPPGVGGEIGGTVSLEFIQRQTDGFAAHCEDFHISG